MLRSLHQLIGHKLGALDGEIGHVKDFYFDDQHWAVRYVITDTGSWLSGRQVLISPHAFNGLDHTGKHLFVNLTKSQIENSPLIETHKPVSRQFELDFFVYYGLPYYWIGESMWGLSSVPVSAPPAKLPPGDPATVNDRSPEHDDPHLRSTHDVTGYRIQASDGDIGEVSDFLIDDKDWGIRQLVVKTGGWFSGKEVQIPTDCVERIDDAESSVSVSLTRAAVEQSPQFHLATVGAIS